MEEKKSRLSPRKRKWLVRGLIIVLLVLAFLIGRAYQQDYIAEKLRTLDPNVLQTNAATNTPVTWKTYSDSTHKFTLNYPSNWTVIKDSTDKSFVLRKGTTKTNITLFYPNNPKATASVPASGSTERIFIGASPVVFNDYFIGLGYQTAAYATVKTLAIGSHIGAIGITIDSMNVNADAQTVKKILSSLKAVQ